MTDQIMMVNLYVRSQAEARSFWLDVMGWKVLREGPLDECRTWLEVAPEGAQTSLSLLEISMINEAMPGRSTPARSPKPATCRPRSSTPPR